MRPPPTCLTCKTNAKVTLVAGSLIYPNRRDLARKQFWHCDGCLGYCGCHAGTDKPLGYPANEETRKARMKLHEERFDHLWKRQKDRPLHRKLAYAYLAEKMGIKKKRCHIAMFTLEQCREAWQILSHVTEYVAWRDAKLRAQEELNDENA